MRIFPIIPIWIMIIICLVLLLFIIRSKKKNWIQIIMVILLFTINLRVMIPSNSSKILANNLDVLFVIDNTISMEAEDYDGTNTRLSGVKEDCKYIINRLNGARFSVITFNNTAKIVTPYTKDTNITIEAIDIIEPVDELYAKGTSLNTPLETIVSSLTSSEKKEDKIRVIFFISDGEITDDSTLKSYAEIKRHVSNGAVLGYGTTTGGNMKVKNKYSETTEYIMDTSDLKYEKAVSKIDEDNLTKIAKDINIDYINMNKQSNINKKLKEIENTINSNLESSDKSTYDDTYYFLVVPLLILLVIELNMYRRKIL